MAERIVTEIIDDIDGSSDATTTSFALDGVVYDIDLGAANRERLEEVLAPFVAHARRSTTSRLMRITKLDRTGRRIDR